MMTTNKKNLRKKTGTPQATPKNKVPPKRQIATKNEDSSKPKTKPQDTNSSSKILSSLAELTQLMRETNPHYLEDIIHNLQDKIQKDNQPLGGIPTTLLQASKKLRRLRNENSQSEPETLIQPPHFLLTKSGFLNIQTPSQELNIKIEEITQNKPEEFLKNLPRIQQEIEKPSIQNKLEIWESAETTAWLLLAYQELKQEEHNKALNHHTQNSNREKLHGIPELEVWKNKLIETIECQDKTLAQLEEIFPEANLAKVQHKIRQQLRRRLQKKQLLSTQEAIDLSDDLAIKLLHENKKKEAPFALRTLLASLYFEEIKNYRNETEHPNDRILRAPSKFHKDTFLMVRHPLHERCELIVLKRGQTRRSNEGEETQKTSLLQTLKEKAQEIGETHPATKKIAQGVLGIISGILVTWLLITAISTYQQSKKPEETPLMETQSGPEIPLSLSPDQTNPLPNSPSTP